MGHSLLMTSDPPTRQEQILRAAAWCFVEEGFHGASMSRIAKRAKMSPGHIYHYFDSKEAIITEIVRQEEISARVFFDRFRSCAPEQLIDLMVDCMEESIEGKADLFQSVLMMEILAEGTRSENILKIIQDIDRDLRAHFTETLRLKLNIDDAENRVETIFALFSGLAIRSIRNPDLKPSLIKTHFAKALRAILEP